MLCNCDNFAQVSFLHISSDSLMSINKNAFEVYK